MRFHETEIPGAFLVAPEPFRDDRGWFARAYCAREFADHGLEPVGAQTNLSFNRQRGTLRGLHYQAEPHTEAKLVRVVRGAIFDVLVDLRPDSPTYRRWFGAELTADDHRALHVPGMCAHGFQTLLDDTLVIYQVSAFYTPDAERGVRYDDPAIGVDWPLPVASISDKDASWSDLEGEPAR